MYLNDDVVVALLRSVVESGEVVGVVEPRPAAAPGRRAHRPGTGTGTGTRGRRGRCSRRGRGTVRDPTAAFLLTDVNQSIITNTVTSHERGATTHISTDSQLHATTYIYMEPKKSPFSIFLN